MPDKRSPARLGFALLLLAASQPLCAQAKDKVEVFAADYFASARPADAYDMVRRLPGFELVEGDEDVRGFAGSRGNVLFDGRAPSGKQESLEEQLRRIPASSVLRIELIRGGAQSAATGGYDLVANLVLRKATSASYSALAGASGAPEIGVKPDFRLEMSRQSGERRLSGAAALETDIDDDSGRGAIVETNSAGDLIGREDRDEREVQRTASLDGEYKLPAGRGELVANLNAARERTLERIESASDDESVVATDRERLWSGEGGLQYRSALAGGDVEALVTHRLGRLTAKAVEEDESFAERTRTSESIARVEFRRGGEDFRWFGSAEGAFNRLTSDARLVIGGSEVPISGSDVHVSERRAEGALGAIWKAGELIVEPSMRAEISTIRSTGDSPQREHFLFWKPRLRATWERGGTRIQSTIEREAAQLDFGDFVASAELDRDDVTAGATSLRPPTTWSFSTTFEQRFWGDGALLLTFRKEWIDDVIDQVLVERGGELFDAVGNIGKGTRRVARAELTAPFDRLGVPGMQMRAGLAFIRSRVTDPTTGEKRIISGDRPFEGSLSLIHDIPGGRWSWGANAEFAHRERDFGFDEVELERKGTSFGAHVEFRPRPDLRFRLEAENIGSRSLVETRDEYDGTRAGGVLDSSERRRIRTAPIFIVSIRKTFGAASD
ncbi:MAG TPA: TonB-dependent receptor plug domain-containing protein [Sphingomicrobium sp.]|nr:TonB-dependent receptor plug domain-containing protein [Sphingomicrobium sp.]